MATKTKSRAAQVSKKPVKKSQTSKSIKSTKPAISASAKAPSEKSSRSKTPTASTSTTSTAQSDKSRKAYIILAIALIAVALLSYKYRGLFVAATVNGHPISRLAVVKEAEKQSGKQTLSNLVRNTLIEQEAKKQNITVSDKEIDAEIKRVEGTLAKQGQKLDQVLSMQGISKQDLRRLIRLDKIVGKLVGKDIKISDKDVDDYIEKNQDSLPKDQPEDKVRQSVKDRLKQQQLNAKVQTWLEQIQSKAKIKYFVQY